MAKKRHGRAFVKVPRKHKRIEVGLFADRLRENMTYAEILLWEHLQRVMHKWGVDFKAQGVVGNRFIADFVAYEQRLIVEVDGSIHNRRAIKRKDAYRTEVLTRLGYRIIRFTNKAVISNCAFVVGSIRKAVCE